MWRWWDGAAWTANRAPMWRAPVVEHPVSVSAPYSSPSLAEPADPLHPAEFAEPVLAASDVVHTSDGPVQRPWAGADDASGIASGPSPDSTAHGPASGWVWPIVMGVFMVLGALVPFVGSDGTTAALRDDPTQVVLLIGIGVVVIGAGLAAAAGHRIGMLVAAGAGWVLAILVAFIIWFVIALNNLLTELGSGVTPHVGFYLYCAAGLIGVGLLPAALGTIGRAHDAGERLPGALRVLLAVGAAALIVGIIVPPVDGMSVSDWVISDDAYVTAFNIAVLATPAVIGLLVLVRGSRATFGLSLGVSLWFFLIWVADNLDFRASEDSFFRFLNGQFAWQTIGTFVLLGASILGTFAARRTSTASGSAMLLTAPALAAIGVVVVAVAITMAREDDDAVGGEFSSEFEEAVEADTEFDEGFVDDGFTSHPTLADLPYDPTYTPLAERCAAGEMSACDELWRSTPVGGVHEAFAMTCGGIDLSVQHRGDCVAYFGP
jgi:hypothetical protein